MTAASRACLAALLMLAACGSPSGVPDTGLSLLVERGPLQPVSRPGQVDTAPVPGAAVVVRSPAGRMVAGAATDSSGRARIALSPADYVVSLESCPGAVSLPQPATFTVSSGSLTDVSLECDTGIR